MTRTILQCLILMHFAFSGVVLCQTKPGESKPSRKVYVWEFQSNIKDPVLIDNVTDEFETALQATGRYSLIERRLLGRLMNRRANEVTDMSNLGENDSKLLKGQGAQAVFFGNIFNDVDSGTVRITVTLESFDGSIEWKKAVKMRPPELRDDVVRASKYKELLDLPSHDGSVTTGSSGSARPQIAGGSPESRPSPSQVISDLAKEWKEGGNPNGNWSFRQGGALLTYSNALRGLGSGVAGGYAPNDGRFIPAVFAASGNHSQNPEDFVAGDIVTHCVDVSDGSANGLLHIDWTAHVPGTVSISAAVWYAQSDYSRENQVSLRFNDRVLANALLSLKSGYSRSSPKLFNTTLKVLKDDRISLYFSAVQGHYGSFAGVRFMVTETPSDR